MRTGRGTVLSLCRSERQPEQRERAVWTTTDCCCCRPTAPRTARTSRQWRTRTGGERLADRPRRLLRSCTRERNEDRSADGGSRAIDRAGKAERPGQHRNRHAKNAIDEDLPRRCGPSGNDRQHGNARARIFVGAIERQRPEMRRRPQEDDQEQNERLEPDLSGRRCPADHRRKRTGGAADDDVLRRLPLQPHRVHDDVEEDREGEQRGRLTLIARARTATAPHARTSPNASASAREILPRGIGRLAVRAITASMSASYHMLSTPAAPAPAAMARIAMDPSSGSR